MGVWDEGFEEPKYEFPEEIIETYIESFTKVTGGYATLDLFRIDEEKRIDRPWFSATFQFGLYLLSQHVRGFAFEVFTVGYDVTIYPIKILVESEIASEIGIVDTRDSLIVHAKTIKDEEEFRNILEKIFKSKRFRKVVGGLIKIAKNETGVII